MNMLSISTLIKYTPHTLAVAFVVWVWYKFKTVNNAINKLHYNLIVEKNETKTKNIVADELGDLFSIDTKPPIVATAVINNPPPPSPEEFIEPPPSPPSTEKVTNPLLPPVIEEVVNTTS